MKYPVTALRLRDALEQKEMSPQELADKSGVSKSSISLYLHGHNEPRTINASKMATVLGCSPLWLMGFDEATVLMQEELNRMVTVSVSEREHLLLETYRSLSDADKDRVDKIVKSLR